MYTHYSFFCFSFASCTERHCRFHGYRIKTSLSSHRFRVSFFKVNNFAFNSFVRFKTFFNYSSYFIFF